MQAAGCRLRIPLVSRIKALSGIKSIEGLAAAKGATLGLFEMVNISSNNWPKRTFRGWQQDVMMGLGVSIDWFNSALI